MWISRRLASKISAEQIILNLGEQLSISVRSMHDTGVNATALAFGFWHPGDFSRSIACSSANPRRGRWRDHAADDGLLPPIGYNRPRSQEL